MKVQLVACPFLFFASSALGWTSWIGALEDWPQKDQSKPDQPIIYESRVRPLFVRVDLQPWQAAPKPGEATTGATLPRTVAWDVCFSGRGEGSVTSIMSDTANPPATPPYTLRESDKAPWRTRRSLDYAGWIPEPVYKPIILFSSMNSSCKDPERWKTGSGEKAKPQIKALIAAANAELAKAEPKESLKEETAKIPRSWASAKSGRFAVLKAKTIEGREVNATFFMDNTAPVFIGFNTMMIDAGDFDGDGKSDLILKQRSEKKDIYMLFNGGHKIAETVWEY